MEQAGKQAGNFPVDSVDVLLNLLEMEGTDIDTSIGQIEHTLQRLRFATAGRDFTDEERVQFIKLSNMLAALRTAREVCKAKTGGDKDEVKRLLSGVDNFREIVVRLIERNQS